MTPQYYWIGERQNPQLKTYYVAYGPLSQAKAKKYGRPIYGCNIMHRFETNEAYQARLTALRAQGERVLPC